MSTLLLAVASSIGAAIGGYLGLITERGVPGLITVAGAVVGFAIGLYIAQLMLAAPGDEEP